MSCFVDTFNLRPYQVDALDQIKSHYRRGNKKVLLHLSTGSGKTVIFSHVMRESALKAKRSIMVVRGRHLVNQAADRLLKAGIYFGVHMAGHKLHRPLAPIQICSVDTLRARNIRPPADIVIIDEAHQATSKSYLDLVANYPDAYFLAVTATPFTKRPLNHLAEVIVSPITFSELVEQGYLVDARYYAPDIPNLENVKVTGGDYCAVQLADIMENNALVGNMVEHYLKIASDRPAICFAVNIEHSEMICDRFNSDGVPCEHMEAGTPEIERNAILERLRTGITKVVTNVGILCTGVDLPHVSCIIMARPTKSYILYIQQAGRGTRPFENKKDFILLDHAGNTLRHGMISDYKRPNIAGQTRIELLRPVRQCEQCFAVYYGATCPACGAYAVAGALEREILHFQGRLS